MNNRIKELRQTLGLSGEKFGDAIGLTRYAISNIENNKNSVTEQTIIAICHVFNVSEEWLRTGKEPMFKPEQNDYFTDLQNRFSLSNTGINLIKSYLHLDSNEKAIIDKLISEALEPSDENKI